MNAAQKKRLEEKNSKLIRELAALPPNRNCFECGQRGPTYVNITEGSFCCTQCSGILRGLNPPHRVKSISMAAFTADEVEKIKSLGNAENTKIWLCLYDGAPPAMTNREAVQAFLIKKYEKKAWYVSKEQLSQQEKALNDLSAREVASRTSSHETASITSGSTATKPSELDLLSNDPFPLVPGASQAATGSQAFSPPAWMAPAPPFPFEEKPKPAANGVDDLFGLLGPAPPPQAPIFPMVPSVQKQQVPFQATPVTIQTQMDPFADFDRKFNDLTVRPSNTVSTFNGLSTLAAPANLPKSATVDSSLSGLLQPVSASNPFQLPPQPLQPMAPTPPPQPQIPSGPALLQQGGDKYSALAELDELFHHSGTNSSQNDGKPAWIPTGFSTGLPPSSTTSNLQNGTPRPVQTTNGFGMPKSQTMGAIADYGVNNPFLVNAPGYSQAFPNPFGPPPTQATYGIPPILQQQQWNLPANPQVPQRPAPTTSTPNWNPFL